MKVVIDSKRMATTKPPAPYALWGPQACVRFAALRGFDFSRPYQCGWDQFRKTFIFEHASMGERGLNPSLLASLANVDRERAVAGQQEAERKKRQATKVFVP